MSRIKKVSSQAMHSWSMILNCSGYLSHPRNCDIFLHKMIKKNDLLDLIHRNIVTELFE
jgi:hypothetical protein